jgi:glycine/sarcosine N-methyltransferase
MQNIFFDNISSYYDDMIGFDAALERRTAMLQNYILPEMQYAADIGCGTGLDSISLSKLGLKVRAFDISSGMIEKAEKNAERYEAKIKFYNSGFSGIPEMFFSSFDIVVSLGNTIANIPPENISTAVGTIFDILKPGGIGVIQILNYERLKRNNERIVNITKNETDTYIRFYDFLEKNINFNILRFNSENPKKRSMDTVTLYSYTEPELRTLFQQNNFKDIEAYGNLNKDPFSDESPDLIITVKK